MRVRLHVSCEWCGHWIDYPIVREQETIAIVCNCHLPRQRVEIRSVGQELVIVVEPAHAPPANDEGEHE
jgi:hypothetical protein